MEISTYFSNATIEGYRDACNSDSGTWSDSVCSQQTCAKYIIERHGSGSYYHTDFYLIKYALFAKV